MQETYYPKKGRFKHDNFVIFEAIRKKEGGGSLLGVHVALNPVLINEHSGDIQGVVFFRYKGDHCSLAGPAKMPQDLCIVSWLVSVNLQSTVVQ